MKKKIYEVKLVETLTYYVKVEADDEDHAHDLAFFNEDFANNHCNNNDTVIEYIKEVLED